MFAVDNSLVVWGLVLAAGLWLRRAAPTALGAAAVLHLALDLALHNDDARRHLWPLSDWVFVSPVSYWDRDHFGAVVGPIELVLTVGLCAWLWRRHRAPAARAAVAALAQAAPAVMWSPMLG